MPRNMSVEEETPTSILLKAAIPNQLDQLPVTSWKVQFKPTKRQLREDFDSVALYDDRPKEILYEPGGLC